MTDVMFWLRQEAVPVPVISDWIGFSFTRRRFSFRSGVEYLEEKSSYDAKETGTK